MFWFKDTVDSFRTYFSYPVSVSVGSQIEVPATFPAVTICNLNPIDGSKANTKKFINTLSSLPSDSYDLKMIGLKSTIYRNASLGKSFMQEIGFDLNDMLISCFYNNTRCNATDFLTYTSYQQGNCYIFNYKMTQNERLKMSSQTGRFNGLKLELFSGFSGKISG